MDQPPKQLASTPRPKPARLCPSLKPSNKEQQATSILLCVFKLVPALLPKLIKTTGVRVNDRTDFRTYTEVNLAIQTGKTKDRQDGFIYIRNRNEWTALVEAKVGNSILEEGQVCRYLEDAKANDINALITISDEFTPRVEQSPLEIPKKYLSKIKLYHLSWRLILSTAQLLQHKSQIEDREKTFILNEFIRFLRDDTVGNKSFSQMPATWPEICSEFSRGVRLKTSDERVQEISASFVEEFSEIALILTDDLGVNCTAKIPRNMRADRTIWQRSIAKELCEEKPLICAFIIPDAANVLFVEIDIAKSLISIGMAIDAPEDRSTISGKVNWFSRQLKSIETENSFVRIRWNSRSPDISVKMNELSGKSISPPGANTTISSFTPLIQIQDNRLFNSRKKFISELEENVRLFYRAHAQHLKAWVPKAPKPIESERDSPK